MDPGVSIDDVQSNDSVSEILSEVACEEDKALIVDVLNAIRACRQPDRLCTSWTVSPLDGTGYTLLAYLPRPQQQHVEVTHDDINIIESVNLLRVRVGVAQFAQGNWALKIRITSHTAPVSFSTYDTTRVTVRRVLLGGGNVGAIGRLMSSASGSKRRRAPSVTGD